MLPCFLRSPVVGLYLRSVAEETGNLLVTLARLTASVKLILRQALWTSDLQQKSGDVGAWGPKTGVYRMIGPLQRTQVFWTSVNGRWRSQKRTKLAIWGWISRRKTPTGHSLCKATRTSRLTWGRPKMAEQASVAHAGSKDARSGSRSVISRRDGTGRIFDHR